MSENYSGQICKFCSNEITEGAVISVCPSCIKPQHTICCRYNLGRCSTLGCKGTPLEVVHSKPEEKKIDLNAVLKPQRIKPKPLKPGYFPKVQRKIPISVPKPAPYIPDYVNMPWEEFKEKERNEERKKKMMSYRANHKYPAVVIDEESSKISYKSIPKPEPFIPEYVFQDLESYLREKSKKDNLKKGVKYIREEPPFFKPEEKVNEEYYSYPKADPYVPDFVFVDMATYLQNKFKEEQSKKGRKALKSSIKIKQKKEEKKLSYQTVPKPEPFIPDYVYADYKDFLWNEYYKKKKKRTPRHVLKKVRPSENFENESLKNYIPVEEPERYVPDFVYATMEEFRGEDEKHETLSMLEQKIIARECPNCLSKISRNMTKCPYCRRVL